jgi:hypothetical protein
MAQSQRAIRVWSEPRSVAWLIAALHIGRRCRVCPLQRMIPDAIFMCLSWRLVSSTLNFYE